MISFPNCKLNLGLNITEKRQDGFHNLETNFIPISLCDVLEFVESDELSFHLHGIKIPGSHQENIVLKAYQLLKRSFSRLPNLEIHLLKNIPSGAGLGGGSSDGSFMLSMLNENYSLGLSKVQLKDLALELGSDCPFFIDNKPVFATGRGEILDACELHLTDYYIYIVKPDLHINTGWAFSNLQPKKTDISCKSIIENYPVNEWKNWLKNDFEIPIFKLHPELKKIKEDLYAYGAQYASMSGSGSAFYGLFLKSELNDINLVKINSHFKNYFSFLAETLN